MEKEYWEKYYAEVGPTEQPSNFAHFCASKYKESMGRMFDIGCGNGRDSLYFSTQAIPCTGIEQCHVATEKNKHRNITLNLNAIFAQNDFSTYDYDLHSSGPYSIYSRFTLHAINYAEEEALLSHLNNGVHLKYIFIEARSLRDGLYGQGSNVGPHEFVTSHYRRFIDPVSLRSKLESNFDIEFFEEAQGFARTETEDPCLIRVIARKK
jgi:tellurite methyltransferase